MEWYCRSIEGTPDKVALNPFADLVPVFGLYSNASAVCPALRNWSRQIMTIDWLSTLQEQAEFANLIAYDVKQTLEIPDLSVAQATRLYRVVEQGAQTFDRIMEEMESANDVDDDLRDGAGSIADVWTNLSVTTANKVRALQGLSPIDFPSRQR